LTQPQIGSIVEMKEKRQMLDEFERAEIEEIKKKQLDHDQKFKQLYPIIEKLEEEYRKSRSPLD
jgi:hypothetical protein